MTRPSFFFPSSRTQTPSVPPDSQSIRRKESPADHFLSRSFPQSVYFFSFCWRISITYRFCKAEQNHRLAGDADPRMKEKRRKKCMYPPHKQKISDQRNRKQTNPAQNCAHVILCLSTQTICLCMRGDEGAAPLSACELLWVWDLLSLTDSRLYFTVDPQSFIRRKGFLRSDDASPRSLDCFSTPCPPAKDMSRNIRRPCL